MPFSPNWTNIYGASGKRKKKSTAAVIPDRLQVPLVIESDFPCPVKLYGLAVPTPPDVANPLPEKTSPPSREKIRLRFPGCQALTRQVTICPAADRRRWWHAS
jgi:hypothetical protein